MQSAHLKPRRPALAPFPPRDDTDSRSIVAPDCVGSYSDRPGPVSFRLPLLASPRPTAGRLPYAFSLYSGVHYQSSKSITTAEDDRGESEILRPAPPQ